MFWIAQEGFCQLSDFIWHGRRKQHRLAVGWQRR